MRYKDKKRPENTDAKTANYPGAPGAHHHHHMELARAYIPIQRFGEVYPPEKALNAGTLFPELYRPYPEQPWR